jgi:hypothetical protein
MTFKNIKFKSPLVTSIENELEKRSLKQRQAADLLNWNILNISSQKPTRILYNLILQKKYILIVFF